MNAPLEHRSAWIKATPAARISALTANFDAVAGCSNTPLVAEFRRRGLDVPCDRVPDLDRDGLPIRRGVYHFTTSDRRKIHAWLRLRDARGKA